MLRAAVESGELVATDKGVYGHMEHLHQLDALRGAIVAARKTVAPGTVKVSERGRLWNDLPRVERAAKSADRIRIVQVASMPGSRAQGDDSGCVTQSDIQGGRGVILRYLDRFKLGRLWAWAQELQLGEKLVLVVQRARKTGGMLRELCKAMPAPSRTALASKKTIGWKGLKIEVRSGTVVPGSTALIQEFKRHAGAFVVAPALNPEAFAMLTQELATAGARRGSKMMPLVVDELVPIERITADNCYVIGLKSGVVRHRQRWLVAKHGGGCLHLEGRDRPVSIDSIRANPTRVAVVRERSFVVPVGSPIIARADFCRASGQCRSGELYRAIAMHPDGTLEVNGGAVFKPGFRLFWPAFISQSLPKFGVPVVIMDAGAVPDLTNELLDRKSCKQLMLLSDTPDATRDEMAGMIRQRITKSREERETKPVVVRSPGS